MCLLLEEEMITKLYRPFLIMAIFVIVVGLACGTSNGDPTSEPQPPTQVPDQPTELPDQEPTEAPPPTPEEQPVDRAGGAVTSLQDAQGAVIYIQAEGTYTYPEDFEEYTAVHSGSGFIIDPSGIAITNNHVVTGAGLLKVWIGGDYDTTYNAKIIGVSECSDLAVIDLEGEGFPYLDWHEGPIQVGMDIYTAGFPLSEPEYTLTKGIVSKEQAAGETSWASLDYVIMHDATINPGNSGGPLLNEDGEVVGVNYRGRAEQDQYFAIDRDLAIRQIETLQSGVDTESIGVNGEAFVAENWSGIWVSSVQAGSVADKAGLMGGDIITTIADLPLATDGTMADYCDILRTHSADDTLDIEVVRFETQEVLKGQLNGEALVTTMTFGGNETGDGGDSSAGGETVGDASSYSGYVSVQDDYGAIQMDIPIEWGDVNGSPWVDGDDVIGSAISAAADLDTYNSVWGESGVFFGVSDDLAKLGGYVNLLDVFRDDYDENYGGQCKFEDRVNYGEGDWEDAYYRGRMDIFSQCGGGDNYFIVLSAVPRYDPQAFLVLVQMAITKDADYEALDQIMATFDVIGSLP
jgi:serine protease Do